MIKRSNFWLSFVLLALLALDIRLDAPFAAEPRGQGPRHVADEIIVRFRSGTDDAQKDQARFRVAGRRKKLFEKLHGLEVVKLPPNVSVEDALEQYRQNPQVL